MERTRQGYRKRPERAGQLAVPRPPTAPPVPRPAVARVPRGARPCAGRSCRAHIDRLSTAICTHSRKADMSFRKTCEMQNAESGNAP